MSDIDLGGIETDTIAITQDGTIYAGDDAGRIIVIAHGRVDRHAAHSAGIKRLVHQSRNALLVSLSYDRTLCVWSVRDAAPRLISQSSLPAEIWPRSCAFVDDQTLAFATFGSSYAVYHVETRRWDLAGVGPTAGLNAVVQHQGRRHTIGDAGILRVDDRAVCETGSLCNFLIPLGSRVFTGGQMGRVMEASTGAVIHQHRSPLNCGATFERDGRPHVVFGTYTGEGLVFALADDGAVTLVDTLQLHANAVKALAVSGGQIFSVCADTAASWFSTADFSETGRAENAHGRIANGCAALPGGRFVSVSRDLKMRIWTDGHARIVDTPHDHSIKCVAASTDGRHVASGSYSGQLALYDLAASSWTRCDRPTTAGISSLSFDATAGHFLASSYDGHVYELGIGIDAP